MSKRHAILPRSCTHTKEHFEASRHAGVPAAHKSETSGLYWLFKSQRRPRAQKIADAVYLQLLAYARIKTCAQILLLIILLPDAARVVNVVCSGCSGS